MRAAWWAAIEAWADPAARPRAPTFLVGRIYNSSSCAAPRQLGSVFLLDACLPYGEQSRLFTRGVLDEIVEERFGDGACSPALAINNITVTTEAGRCAEYYEDYSLSAVFSLEASLPSDLSSRPSSSIPSATRTARPPPQILAWERLRWKCCAAHVLQSVRPRG